MQLNGIIGYLLSPCDTQGEIDHRLLAQHIEYLVQAGVHGLAPLGSVGCLPYLNDDERVAVLDTTVAVSAGRVPVLAGVSSMSTAQTLRHARLAEAAGVDAIQVLPSTYWKLTEDETFAYYRQVSDAVSLPIMVYNNPFVTGLDMSVALLQRLTALPNIRLIKEASPEPGKIARLCEACGPDVKVFAGVSSMALQGLRDGAAGWATAAPNVCAPAILDFYRRLRTGDLDGAAAQFERQTPLLDYLLAHGLPRTISAAMTLLGRDPGHLRAPLAPLEAGRRQILHTLLKTLEMTP